MPARASAATAAPDNTGPEVEARSNGFDWGDAGLGAAGMLTVLGLGTGALVIARRGRGRATMG